VEHTPEGTSRPETQGLPPLPEPRPTARPCPCSQGKAEVQMGQLRPHRSPPAAGTTKERMRSTSVASLGVRFRMKGAIFR